MRKAARHPAPPRLTRYAQKWTDGLLDAIEHHQQGQAPKPADTLWDKYNKQYVKQALCLMFHSKCAYCEARITHVAYPHIEHYRPKSKYPHLTFAWENFLLACELCNTSKSDEFPLEDGDEARPLLLNPCDDEPEEHIRFEEARAIALNRKGAVTCELVKLNRDTLFDARRAILNFVVVLGKSIRKHRQQGNVDEVNEGYKLLVEMMQPECEYVGMVRQIIREAFTDLFPAE